MNRKIIAPLAAALFLLSSCSQRIVGTWQVSKYETTVPGQQGVALSNIGTMNFQRNGKGEKDISYNVFGVQKEDKTPFSWIWNDGKYVSIKSDGSDFAKTWIIVENKRKQQRWKSTDGQNGVQILELTK